MKKYVLSLLLLCIMQNTIAQTWQWARRGGGGPGLNDRAEKIVDMQCDKNGNVYMLAQLDGGSGITVGTQGADSSLENLRGGRDGALISYDCTGKLRWYKIFGSNGDNIAAGMNMDTLGNIYVAMQTDASFYVGTDSFTTNVKRKVIGLIQYDTAGHFKWFRQPSPDSINSTKNLSQYGVFNMASTANGDTYLYCSLGTGLISGSTNLVATTPGLYMLKYNIAGIPKELIKLDMTMVTGGNFSYTNFSVTNSRKFVFTGLKAGNKSYTTYPIVVGGQVLKHPINLICFGQTGSVLWRVENKVDTSGSGLQSRPYIDNNKGVIYTVGFVDGQQTDTINGIIIKNALGAAAIPFILCLDTFGNNKWLSKGDGYWIGSLLRSLTFRSDGRLFASGYGGGIIWGGYNFYGGNGGYQIFMPSFDANTGAIMSMDSLKGSADATFADVMAADNNNNIYLGGSINYDVKVGNQTLQSVGGQTDFFVAKYGYANCTGAVPLKFINYAVRQAQGDKVENVWTTANEVNVSHFNVQRSFNGRDFINIGKVSANNKNYNEYSFTDDSQQLIVDGGLSTIYYRIESVDFDGRQQYSEVKTLNPQTQTLNGISIYPNPAKDMVTIDCKGAKEILIIDCFGRVVQKFSNTSNSLLWRVGEAKGVYTVKAILANNKVIISKFIKQ